MIGGALALLGALVVGGRVVYPLLLERRARRLRPLGPDGIIVGAQAIELPRDDAPAVLLIHGGGDTPQVLAGLAEYLHGRGFSVSAPLLAGHGRSLAEYSGASSAAWYEEIEREYARLRAAHPTVFIVGLSMGGALALPLAVRQPEIPALALLAPYVDMPAALQRLATTSRLWGWMLPYLPSLGRGSIHDPAAAARGLGHRLITPGALRALHEVMTKAREALPEVSIPTLVVQSREDNRISTDSAQKAFDLLGSREKKLEWVDGAGHVITVDYGRERVFELVGEWLLSHRKDESPAHRARLSPSSRPR
jgi:carboxylesterase